MTEDIDYDAITWPSQLTKGVHRSMYPLIEPSNPSLSAAGKTVLVTGASGGIGRAIAQAWTTAGAKGIVITGRRLEALKELESKLQEISQGRTKVVVVQADITQEDSVEKLWQQAARELGTINVLINNAGSLTQAQLGQDAPSKWWHDFEVNIKAPHLNIHHFLAQSPSPSGTVITLSTGTLGDIYPNFSSYIPSKLAATKVMEFLHAEQPLVRCFSIFPGLVATEMPPRQYLEYARDDPMLSGGLSLYLATERAEWLRGCMVSVNWDLEEMEQHREEIIDQGL
ncbi:hypothetical protein N0V95_008664, partial [Ascochyta clinopodiicola]